MSDILHQIARASTQVRARGQQPARVVLGHRQAAQLEAALYHPATIIRGLRGDVIAEEEEIAPKFPYPLTERCTLFGTEMERVDEDDRLEVVPA